MPARHLAALAVGVLLGACGAVPRASHDVVRVTPERDRGEGPRVLAVVAHPDDELAFGGVLYKTATFLDGVCDVVVITNGEGGFKYATLAERIYGLELTVEAVGRRHLPAIRRGELVAGARILGLRDVHFLGQRDHRYTLDLDEVLGPAADVWDLAAVRAALDEVLERGGYDFVLTLAPTPSTHAHHKAAALLALEAVAALPAERRPVVLCRRPRDDEGLIEAPEGWPSTAVAPPDDALRFDRGQRFGFRERLDYRIVVDWAIAEHKSQGTMQLLRNGAPDEDYLRFRANPPDAREQARELFVALARPQFPARTYATEASVR